MNECINLAKATLRRKKSSASFKKTTSHRKPTENIFSGLDHIDYKINKCIKLAEETLNEKWLDDQEYQEFTNPWASNDLELQQEQAFINYLDELDGPISKDELAEWSSDIDLFMEGLLKPDKLEVLWEQSKAKKLWDESQRKSPMQLD